MNTTEEDLRAATVLINEWGFITVDDPEGADLANRIASMRAAEREKAWMDAIAVFTSRPVSTDYDGWKQTLDALKSAAAGDKE